MVQTNISLKSNFRQPQTIDKKNTNTALGAKSPEAQDIFFIHSKTKYTCISLIRQMDH